MRARMISVLVLGSQTWRTYCKLMSSDMTERSVRQVRRPNIEEIGELDGRQRRNTQTSLVQRKGAVGYQLGKRSTKSRSEAGMSIYRGRLASLAGGLKYAFTMEGYISHELGSLRRPSCSHFLNWSLFLLQCKVRMMLYTSGKR